MLGIIDHAILNERWVGVAGQATRYNGVACKTRDTCRLEHASLYATSPDMFTASALGQFERLSAGARFRAFGGDCYNYGLLASGFIDIVCEAGLQPYDYCALVPAVQGAGGVDQRLERAGGWPRFERSDTGQRESPAACARPGKAGGVARSTR